MIYDDWSKYLKHDLIFVFVKIQLKLQKHTTKCFYSSIITITGKD